MKKLFGFLFLTCTACLFFTCQKEPSDKETIPLSPEVAKAKEFFDSNSPRTITTRSASKPRFPLDPGKFTPYWHYAVFSDDHQQVESVDVPISTQFIYGGYFCDQPAIAYLGEESALPFTFITTRLIVTTDKQTGELFSYFMHIIPDDGYSIYHSDEYMFYNSRQNEYYCGKVIYQDIETGEIVRADRYIHGERYVSTSLFYEFNSYEQNKTEIAYAVGYHYVVKYDNAIKPAAIGNEKTNPDDDPPVNHDNPICIMEITVCTPRPGAGGKGNIPSPPPDIPDLPAPDPNPGVNEPGGGSPGNGNGGGNGTGIGNEKTNPDDDQSQQLTLEQMIFATADKEIIDKIQKILEQILTDCMGEKMVNTLAEILQGKNTIKITFDSSEEDYYDPYYNQINIANQNPMVVFHELNHRYQFYIHGNDLDTWRRAQANLELENLIATYRFYTNMPEGPEKEEAREITKENPYWRYLKKYDERIDSKGNYTGLYNEFYLNFDSDAMAISSGEGYSYSPGWTVERNLRTLKDISDDC